MPWTVGSGCCAIVSRRLVGDTSTQTALLSVEQRPARCLRNTAHQFLAGQVNSEGLNKSHDGQPSSTSGFDPNQDCPVPRLTLLFFGAAKDVPEAAKMVTRRSDEVFPPATTGSNGIAHPEFVGA
jgi:hypothetical protein